MGAPLIEKSKNWIKQLFHQPNDALRRLEQRGKEENKEDQKMRLAKLSGDKTSQPYNNRNRP
uniref:Uncharacterized protein n=1 Tax=Meloidogyne incognita TaxID=6306 RepID=A0A914M864_MELIC